MIKIKAAWAIGMVLAGILLAGAAPVAKGTGFKRVPTPALKALGAIQGKPIKTGWVFVNGHYLKPPYVVQRFGTALRVNGTQITGPLVPWKKFEATQKTVAEGAEDDAAEAKDVDDLFEEEEEEEEAKPAASAAAFVENERSKRLVKTINDARTELDKELRRGKMYFFSTVQTRIELDPRIARDLVKKLPEALRDATDGADLARRLRAAGITYLNAEQCDQVVANRADYVALIDRRRTLEEQEKSDCAFSSGSGLGL